jgi:hypothetical protein
VPGENKWRVTTTSFAYLIASATIRKDGYPVRVAGSLRLENSMPYQAKRPKPQELVAGALQDRFKAINQLVDISEWILYP